MRGRKERRYLTEKYQNKQVRIAYATAYAKPYDRYRYILTEFAKRRRFYDMLCGNYVEWATPYAERWALGEGWKTPHRFTKAELGRLRKQSFTNCGDRRCCYCYHCNPRRGFWAHKELTRQEIVAELYLKEEKDYYKEKGYETCKKHPE